MALDESHPMNFMHIYVAYFKLLKTLIVFLLFYTHYLLITISWTNFICHYLFFYSIVLNGYTVLYCMNLYYNLLTTCLLLEIIIFIFCLYLINSLIDKNILGCILNHFHRKNP